MSEKETNRDSVIITVTKEGKILENSVRCKDYASADRYLRWKYSTKATKMLKIHGTATFNSTGISRIVINNLSPGLHLPEDFTIFLDSEKTFNEMNQSTPENKVLDWVEPSEQE